MKLENNLQVNGLNQIGQFQNIFAILKALLQMANIHSIVASNEAFIIDNEFHSTWGKLRPKERLDIFKHAQVNQSKRTYHSLS